MRERLTCRLYRAWRKTYDLVLEVNFTQFQRILQMYEMMTTVDGFQRVSTLPYEDAGLQI